MEGRTTSLSNEDRPTSGSITRPWAACLALGMVALLAHALLPTGEPLRTVAFHGVSAIAVAAGVAGLARSGASRHAPWLFVAAGQALFVVADLGLSWLEVVGDAFAVVGLLILVRRRMAGHMVGGLIDAAILTTAVAALSWTYVLRPLASASGLDPLSTGASLGFPVADLAVVAAALALLTAPGTRSVSLVALGLGHVLVFAADQAASIQALNGAASGAGPADSIHLLAFVSFAVAALHPSARRLTDRQLPGATWLGYARQAGLAVAIVTGPILFLIGPNEPRTAVGVATGVMSVLVLLRLAGLVRLLEADIAARRVLEASLTHEAEHDHVTGLANRRRFVAQAEAALAARRAPGSIAALFIDLNDFKTINDELGHAAGDEALAIVGRRIQGAVRDGDLAARLGGDEFGVLVLGLADRNEAVRVGERIAAALTLPLALATGPVVVGASIGTAIDGPGTADVDELLRRADIAMYEAKASRGGSHQVVAGDPLGAVAGPAGSTVQAA